MTPSTKATPRPWAIEGIEGYPTALGIGPKDGERAFAILTRDGSDSEDQQQANAELIIEAVNAHDTLLAERDRLRQAMRWILDVADTAYNEDSGNDRIHEIFNIAAQSCGIKRRLPDEYQRFTE